jgi:hypothetical protein
MYSIQRWEGKNSPLVGQDANSSGEVLHFVEIFDTRAGRVFWLGGAPDDAMQA